MSRFDKLLDKAVKNRHLSAEELEMVKGELLDPETPEDRSTLIHILGHAGDPDMAPLVERFLVSPEDPFLAWETLQVLCNSWGLAEKYRAVIMEFMEGVAWDDNDDVRLMAISCAGELIRNRPDPELVRLLVDIAEEDTEDELFQEAAMSTLARGVGLSWNEIPGVGAGPKTDSELGRRILEKARSMGQ